MEILDIIKLTAESFGLQVVTMRHPYDEWEQLDYGFRKNVITEYDYEYIKKQIKEALQPNTLLYFCDDFGVYYYAFIVPKKAESDYADYMFLGPFRYRMNSMEEVKEMKKRMEFSRVDMDELKNYFELVPVVNEIAPLQALMTGLFSKLYSEKGFLFVAADLKEPLSMYKKQIKPPENLENDYMKLKIEKRYFTLDLLLKEVCEGNTRNALGHLRLLLKYMDEYEGEKRQKEYRKLAEELNILLRYRAHRYNVHSLYCEDMYQKFVTKLTLAKLPSTLQEIIYEIVADYSQLIRERSRRHYSNLIRDCVDYIDSHYSEPLTLTSEANRLLVSDTYLSSRFIKETGMNFVEYVNTVRVRYACILLIQLQLPIQRISELCGFTSSNYFARVFRQIEGRTPREYRQVMQKKNG